MLDKVDVSKIVCDHIATLRDYSTGKYRPADFLLFFGVPFVVSTLLVVFYGNIKINLITIVATSLSVFTALLLNLLLLVYDAIRKSEDSGGDTSGPELRRRFLGEVFSNISFATLVAIGAIALVLFLVVVEKLPAASRVLSALVYYLVSLFLLTLLMLLKRVHVLIRREINGS